MKHALFFYMPDSGIGSGPANIGNSLSNTGDTGKTVTVGSNDSTLSIAKENGFWWSTVWNHPKNSQVKALRKKPEVLQEGDELYVPKAEPKKESKPNEAVHKFKLKGEQAKFKIKLMMMDEPRANEDYTLVVDGEIKNGKTDGNGMIETDIPNDAKGGVLKLQGGKEVLPITIGRLDPNDSPSGVRQRLTSLGHLSEPDGPADQMPAEALKAFQEKYKLNVSGELDAATKAKLQELHPA